MTNDDFSQLLQLVHHGREERSLEYKQSMDWKAEATKVKVAKAVMAMANLPYGGTIVFGVEKDGTALGMSKNHVDSFDQDNVMDWVNKYAEPPVDFSVIVVPEGSKDYVALQVRPFPEIPVICKKTGPGQLEAGDVYGRSS